MEGLPDTGSHPAQMSSGVSYCDGLPRRKDRVVCVISKQIVRGLARMGPKNACGKTKTRCHQFNGRKAWETIARSVENTCKVNYRKVCRKYLQGKLSQGM
jgi:hypothetical protein